VTPKCRRCGFPFRVVAAAARAECSLRDRDTGPITRRGEVYDASLESSRFLRSSLAGCSTSATTRLAMNLAVRTGSPVRVTSTTSTMPRPVVISTRRPARVATIS
jgi:hypothetical protein